MWQSSGSTTWLIALAIRFGRSAIAMLSFSRRRFGARKGDLNMITRERLGILAIALVAATVGGIVTGYVINAANVEAAPAVPKVMSANKFVLLDNSGKARAQLDITAKGVAQVAVMDGNGVLRAGLG